MRKKNKNETAVLFEVPRCLRNQFKAKCAQNDMSMSEVVRMLMEKVANGKIKISKNISLKLET